MDEETKKQVESTVRGILKDADMGQTTERQVRSKASDLLGLDLSLPDRKSFVRNVVEAFLDEQTQQKEPKVAEEEAEDEAEDAAEKDESRQRKKEKRKAPRFQQERQLDEEFDDEGNPIICHLSSRRRVTLQEFKGKKLLSLREYYEKDGKQLPTSKGISLPIDQWRAVRDAAPDVRAKITLLKGRVDKDT